MTDAREVVIPETQETNEHNRAEARKVVPLIDRRHTARGHELRVHRQTHGADVISLEERRAEQVRRALTEHEATGEQHSGQRVESDSLDQSSVPPSDAPAEQQTKELKSRLSRALTKLSKGTHNFFVGKELEPRPDHYFTQEELLRLVKKAEAEVREEKAKEHAILYPLAEAAAITGDIGVLEQQATQLNGEIEENEASVAFFVDQEQRGEKVKKEEFIALWEKRGELTNNLYYIEQQQKAYANSMAEKQLTGLIRRLFAPVNRLVMKTWISLNRANPGDTALARLQGGYYRKTEQFRKIKKNGKHKGPSVFETLQIERARPAALAAAITRFQEEKGRVERTTVSELQTSAIAA